SAARGACRSSSGRLATSTSSRSAATSAADSPHGSGCSSMASPSNKALPVSDCSSSPWSPTVRSRSARRVLLKFFCGSRSTHRTRKPRSMAKKARFRATVVLPTPPFWLAIAMVFMIVRPFPGCRSGRHRHVGRLEAQLKIHHDLQPVHSEHVDLGAARIHRTAARVDHLITEGVFHLQHLGQLVGHIHTQLEPRRRHYRALLLVVVGQLDQAHVTLG